MQIVASLGTGGQERVAVNIANALPSDRFRSFICSTRFRGQLQNELSPKVGLLHLSRRWRFQWGSLRKLQKFIRENHIQILHAHGPSIFHAVLVSLFAPHPKVIWHVHLGSYAADRRRPPVMWALARRTDAVITVNQALADWSIKKLGLSAARVRYISNFVAMKPCTDAVFFLPGKPGSRIVCVANIRPPKDQLNLIQAMDLVRTRFPEAHLCLIGYDGDEYSAQVKQEIITRNLSSHVSVMGIRSDISYVLAGSDIGVLSSQSEGMSLSLLEYGMAKLPVVATRVGAAAEILDEGQAGILVPAGDSQALAEGICSLLASHELRTQLASQFHKRIQNFYCSRAIVGQVAQVYETVLSPNQ